MVFLAHVQRLRFSSDSSFVSLTSIGKRMGKGTRQVRRIAAAVEEKGLLKRQTRPGRTSQLSLFDAPDPGQKCPGLDLLSRPPRSKMSGDPGQKCPPYKNYSLEVSPDGDRQAADAAVPESPEAKKPTRKTRVSKQPADPRLNPNTFLEHVAQTCPDVSLAARSRLCGQVKPILKDLLRSTDDPQSKLREMWETFRAGRVDGQWPMSTGKPHDVETFCQGTIQNQLLQATNGRGRVTVPCPKCGSPADVADGVATCPNGCQKWRVSA